MWDGPVPVQRVQARTRANEGVPKGFLGCTYKSYDQIVQICDGNHTEADAITQRCLHRGFPHVSHDHALNRAIYLIRLVDELPGGDPGSTPWKSYVEEEQLSNY